MIYHRRLVVQRAGHANRSKTLVRPAYKVLHAPHPCNAAASQQEARSWALTAPLVRAAASRSRTGSSTSSSSGTDTSLALSFRQGQPSDLPAIVQAVLSEWMNPLGLDPSRFLVATTKDEQGEEVVLGWGQLKQLSTTPTGGVVWELATLITFQPHRGKGVGSAVVRGLLQRAPPTDRVLLCTITRTQGFYERLGFQPLPAGAPLPGLLDFEVRIGSVVAPLVTGGERMVVMEAVRGQAL